MKTLLSVFIKNSYNPTQRLSLIHILSGKGLLPLGKEAGAGRDVPVDSGIYFVPELGQEQPVLGTLGDFFDFASIHVITTDKYNTFSTG